MKRGFTVIELLMVIAILAVLLGIITTAATASIRQSRDRKTQAMKQTLQNGIAAYRVRKDKWPGKLDDWSDQVSKGKVGYLSNTDYDKVVQELLKESTGRRAKTRVMDPVGLSVIPVNAADDKILCMDFREVTTKKNKHAKLMDYNEMTVVYPKTENGNVLRYVIEYTAESDEVTVMTRSEYHEKVAAMTEKYDVYWEGTEVWY